MKLLRHEAHADERWDYQPATRTVIAHFKSGDVAIPVCTQKHPRIGGFFIHRRGDDEWQISPARCVDNGKGYSARPASYDADGVHCDFITLIGAPAGINNLLGDLYEDYDDETPTQRMCPKCNAKGYTREGECSLCHGACAISFELAHAYEASHGHG